MDPQESEIKSEKVTKPMRRRFRLRRSRKVPLRALLPNMITLLGLSAGLTSIRMAIEGRFDLAIALIVLAGILDGIDGRVARLLKASSRFGAELDSLADFVNFGVAPAVLIFTWGLTDLKSLGWIFALAFAVAAALRLARFNVALDDPEGPEWKKKYFDGVPAPAGALCVMLPIYLQQQGLTLFQTYPQLILAYIMIMAALLVSNLPTFSGKLWGHKIGAEYALPIILVGAVFIAVLVTYPYPTLTFCSLVYLGFLPFSFAAYRRDEASCPLKAADNDDERPRHLN